MNLSNVILTVEDRLSDAVATKILETFDAKIVKRIGFQGKSDLERKTPELNRAANGITVFMLTDLDTPQERRLSVKHWCQHKVQRSAWAMNITHF